MQLNKIKEAVNNLSYSSGVQELENCHYKVRPVGYLHGIRKALQSGRPVLASVSAKPLLIVGEDDGELAAYKDNMDETVYTIRDADFEKLWDGQAVEVEEQEENELPRNLDMIIRLQELDTWPDSKQDLKTATCNTVYKINQLHEWQLPAHPIILKFMKPDPDKGNIRACLDGAEISLFDYTDPVMEFGHELGHVFWKSRVDHEEREAFFALHTQLTKLKESGDVPAIFTSPALMEDKEEMFCTLYAWYLLGCIRNEGYARILKSSFPEGCALLHRVLDRLHCEHEARESQRRELQEWNSQAPAVSMAIAKANGEGTFVINGQLRKAKIITSKQFVSLKPPKHTYKTITEHAGREWIEFRGSLQGERAVLKAGVIDLDYMQSRPGISYKLPVYNGKRTIYVLGSNVHKAKASVDPWLPKNFPEPKARQFAGFSCMVETPADSYRFWTDQNGVKGKTKMQHDYGYIKRVNGNDGDRLDAFLGPYENTDSVTVVHQNNPETGEYDEDKVMLGFLNESHALDAYRQHYTQADKFIGGFTTWPVKEFRERIQSLRTGEKLEKARQTFFGSLLKYPGLNSLLRLVRAHI